VFQKRDLPASFFLLNAPVIDVLACRNRNFRSLLKSAPDVKLGFLVVMLKAPEVVFYQK
jgi:hypothetical protein